MPRWPQARPDEEGLARGFLGSASSEPTMTVDAPAASTYSDIAEVRMPSA
jgi:hypothetical protein